MYNGEIPFKVFSNPTPSNTYTNNFFPHSSVAARLEAGPLPLTIVKAPQVYLVVGTVDPPYVIQIILAENNPFFVLDLLTYQNGYYNISVPDNHTLDVSIASDNKSGDKFSNYDIYDGEEYIGT